MNDFPEIVVRGEVPPDDVLGAYVSGEAEGAYPNGIRILKVASEEGDGTPIGTGGFILSSLNARGIEFEDAPREVSYFYFVKWDDFPHPVGIQDWKIGKESVL